AESREGGGVEGASGAQSSGARRRRADGARAGERHDGEGAPRARPLRMRLRALAAVVVVAAAAVACGGARSPDGAVRALAEAAESGDRDGVYALLGPATRARLASDAEHAAQAAGRRELGPTDLVAAGWSPPKWHAVDFDVLT